MLPVQTAVLIKIEVYPPHQVHIKWTSGLNHLQCKHIITHILEVIHL